MARLTIASPLAALFLSVLMPQMVSQTWAPAPPLLPPRPLCSSQFALANYACARLPVNPEPIPIPQPPEEGRGHKRSHGHHHRHSHAHHHSAVAEDCCRWAREVDSECVCEVLVHLANFLARPSHTFTIAVTEDCIVTYSCGGRIKI